MKLSWCLSISLPKGDDESRQNDSLVPGVCSTPVRGSSTVRNGQHDADKPTVQSPQQPKFVSTPPTVKEPATSEGYSPQQQNNGPQNLAISHSTKVSSDSTNKSDTQKQSSSVPVGMFLDNFI